MSLNRNIAPEFHLVDRLYFPKYETRETKNGFKIYSLKAGVQPVVRLDFIFDAGLTHQVKNAEAAFTASMLSEGTAKRNALSLAESLDFFGSYFQTRCNADDAVASLYCLNKHFDNCLPLFLEALIESIFPAKELDIQKKNSLQKLSVNEKKNSYLCRKNFYQNLLGEKHPYAAFSSKEDIGAIDKNSLEDFHKTHYLEGLKYLMLSGCYSAQTLNNIEESMAELPFSKPKENKLIIPDPSSKIGKHFIEKTDSVQSAIRIGKISILRNHEDFRKLQFLNLIFGGYFGSRLMKNIREDKGLTYGIYSVIEPFKEASVWYIDSDMNSKNRENGLTEIYKELNRICTEPIPQEEIDTARNYYLGSFLRSLDGPFSLADRLKTMIDNNLPDSYYPDFVKILNDIEAKDLQNLANKYFDMENIVEMVVGKK